MPEGWEPEIADEDEGLPDEQPEEDEPCDPPQDLLRIPLEDLPY